MHSCASSEKSGNGSDKFNKPTSWLHLCYWEVKTLAFPNLFNVMISIIVFVVGVAIVYLSSKALKLRPKPIAIAEPRKEATPVFLVVVATFVLTSILVVFTNTVFIPTFQLDKRPPFTFDVINVLWTAFSYAVWFLVLTLGMKKTGQNLGSIGISGENKGRMLALGLIPSVVYVTVAGFVAPSLGGGFNGLSSSLVYGLIVYTLVGFSEEIVWRGYVQTRLIALSGTSKGLVTTAMLFALFHFPTRFYLYSGVALEGLVSAILLFPVSLLFGYMMLRSQNIIPSSIFHLLVNWSTLFWQIPTF